ncbi:hypothetical protein [Methanocella sp. MCL-LM]|uniref:hypothetical protein n=1 Tax=Methanocella sp. MCL-LM TaxID=3412035 RepID=UPI003C71CDF8
MKKMPNQPVTSEEKIVTQDVIVSRWRYFYKFIDVTTIKISEEITVYNPANRDQETIRIPFEEFINPFNEDKNKWDRFKPYLHVYDTCGESLEFWTLDDNIDFLYIDLPKDSKLSRDKFTTVRLEYIIEVDHTKTKQTIVHDEELEYKDYLKPLIFPEDVKVKEIELAFKLRSGAKTYVFIEHCDKYKKDLFYLVTDSKFKGDQEKTKKVKKEDGERYTHIRYGADPEEGLLFVTIRYSIPRHMLGWSYLGVCIGIFSFFGILLLSVLKYALGHHNYEEGFTSTYLGVIVAWGVFAISAMIMIKGWLVDKDYKSDLITIHDSTYKWIAALITIEVAILLLIIAFINK